MSRERRLRRDIRTLGSGNAGALNVAREVGPPWGLLVLLLDAATTAGLFATSLGLLTGHNWTVALGFRGGKGVAPVLGISLVNLPGLTLITRALTVAAFSAGLTVLDPLTLFTGQPLAQVVLCFLLTLIVTATHLYGVLHQRLAAFRVRRCLDFFAHE